MQLIVTAILVLYIGGGPFIAMACLKIAMAKNRNKTFFLMGLFLNLVGLVWVLCLKKAEPKPLVEPSKSWMCFKCGALNNNSNKFCTECGTEKQLAISKDNLWVCPQCNAVNISKNKFCKNCGKEHQ